MTQADRREVASAWNKQLLDLSESFDKTFRVYLGDHDEGTEGMVFALQSQGSAALGQSGLLGYYPIKPSVGVEIDTYVSGRVDGGIDDDHLGVNLNGDLNNTGHEAVYARESERNIEDGQEHQLRVIWNAEAKALDVHFDGDERMMYQSDVVASIFGGDPSVFLGFTSGTQDNFPSYLSRHYFCETTTCFDPSEPVRVAIGDVEVEEGDAGTIAAIFPVTLSCPSDQPVSIEFATVDETATGGSDYHAASGTVTFQPGETSQHVTVEVLGDTLGEATERFFVRLSDPVGAEIRYGEGVGTITSDDALFILDGMSYAEGDRHYGRDYVVVRLPGPVTREARVHLKTTGGSADAGPDYSRLDYDVRFMPGDTEGDENFFFELSGVLNGTVLKDPVEFHIQDDDDAVCPTGPNLIGDAEAAGNGA